MNNAEITAYNYGRRLAEETVKHTQDPATWEPPAAAILTEAEKVALDRLGMDRWWRFVLQGGNEIIGEPDVVPPLQT